MTGKKKICKAYREQYGDVLLFLRAKMVLKNVKIARKMVLKNVELTRKMVLKSVKLARKMVLKNVAAD